jgi:hypothetical protein
MTPCLAAGRRHYLSAPGGDYEEIARHRIRLPLPVAGRIVTRQKSIGDTLMVEKQQEPDGESTTGEGHNAHPVEPAEGAPEPGEDADTPRPRHPDEPAEGER